MAAAAQTKATKQAQLRGWVAAPGNARLSVDTAAGIIRGAAVMTIGPTKGHGFSIDRITLEQTRALIASKPDGVIVRFKHQGMNGDGSPMTSPTEKLGTACATLHNPRIDGNVLRADIHVGSYAAALPGLGDVRSYLLNLAKEAPTKVGLSADFFYTLETAAGANVARIVELQSVDFVESPAANNHGLLAEIGQNMDPKIRELLVAAGMPETATDEEAMAFLKQHLQSAGDTPAPAQMAAVQAVTLAERARVQNINALGSILPGGNQLLTTEQVGQLVNNGATVEQARLAALQRAAVEFAPIAVAPRDDIRVGPDRHLAQLSTGAAHALCARGGVRPAKLAARAEQFAGMPATEISRRMLEVMGVDTRGMSRATLAMALINPEKALGNQYVRYAQLAQSTGDFTNVLTSSVNAALRTGYEEAGPTWNLWAKRGTAPDFKNLERPVLSGIPTPIEVGELEEYSNANLIDAKETFKVKKYGHVIGLSLESIINDNLNAFMSITKKHGAACGRLEDDLAYAQLTSNPTLDADSTALFHSSHSNLTSSGTVLSVTSLGVARALMAKQTGLVGEVLNVKPYALLVPVAIQTLAEQLVASLVDPSKSNDTSNPAFIRSLIVVGDARLDAASATAWYLAASPNSIDTVEVAFLEDQPAPFIEEQEGFRVDGTSFKVRHVVAARALDYRGLYKNVGA